MGLKDECGVAGIFGAENAASLSYFTLTSLQHRGQESAGIAVSDGKSVRLKKKLGLVGDIFAPADFEKSKGNIAVSHVRYATAGGRTIENAQPFLNTFKNGALAHNGQLVNHASLREKLEDGGSTFASNSDSEVILKLIVRKFIEKSSKPGSGKSLPQDDDLFVQAVIAAMKEIKGAFALCIMTENMLLAPAGGRLSRRSLVPVLGEGEENSIFHGVGGHGRQNAEKLPKLLRAILTVRKGRLLWAARDSAG